MGQSIAATLAADPELECVGIWSRETQLEAMLPGADVVVDFSMPDGTIEVLAAACQHEVAVVCGVSGLDEHQTQALASAAKTIPVLYDRNMSLGVAVLMRVVRDAAAALGDEFSVAVAETHHVHKKDAPSGTALQLGEAIEQAVQGSVRRSVEYQSQRIGEVPGDHEVTFSSAAERLSFCHSVTTRQVFVDGALRAARWIVGRSAGLYSMQDVVFGDISANK